MSVDPAAYWTLVTYISTNGQHVRFVERPRRRVLIPVPTELELAAAHSRLRGHQ